MSVLGTYDINAKANEISDELKKVNHAGDKSAVLFEEMRIMAMNNMQRLKIGLKNNLT